MSLIYRSLEQLRRQQAGAEVGMKAAPAQKPRRGGRMRTVLALMAGAFLLLGVGLMGVAWYFGDDVSMIAQEQPKGVGTMEAARAKREATREKALAEETETRKAQAEAEQRRLAEEKAKALAQERAIAELAERRKAKEDAERKAREEQAALEARAALAALETTDAPDPPAAAAAGAAPAAAAGGGASGQQGPAQPLSREQALDMHFTSQAQRNMRIHTIERSLNAIARTEQMDAIQKEVSQLTGLVGADSLAAHKWKGFMAMKQNRYTTAIKHLTAALAMAPEDLQTRYNLALALVRNEQAEKARQVLEPLLEKHGDDDRIKALAAYLTAMRAGRP